MSLFLSAPDIKYIESARMSCEEYATSGEKYYTPFELNENFIEQRKNFSKGLDLPEGFVPWMCFWLIDGDEYIGEGSIRYALTKDLKKYGGNIDYTVRPSKRNKGYGTLLLRLLLNEAANLGMKKVLLTCAESNVASYTIMEKNGADYIDTINVKIEGKVRCTRRYYIKTGLVDGRFFSQNKWWYHGSNFEFSYMMPGSTITQNKALAEAFSHKPRMVEIDDKGNISHNGTQEGYLYIISEAIIPGDNIYMHPRSTMEKGLEWITTRTLKVKLL